jgi:Rrf2 family protein
MTRKVGYGLMALKYMAEQANDASLCARNIAEAYHIPLQLLAKSLQRLAKVGILRSHAGMSGGYSLLKPLQQISVFEVISDILKWVEINMGRFCKPGAGRCREKWSRWH